MKVQIASTMYNFNILNLCCCSIRFFKVCKDLIICKLNYLQSFNIYQFYNNCIFKSIIYN